MYRGRTSSRCRKSISAVATTLPIFRLDASLLPTISFLLVITRTSLPDDINLDASSTAFSTICSAISFDESNSSTSMMIGVKCSPRPVVRDSSWAVVFGTYDPAIMRPPGPAFDKSNFRLAADFGGICWMPRRVETKAAPVRYMYLFPALFPRSRSDQYSQTPMWAGLHTLE